MSLQIQITRDEAEMLVDLLEGKPTVAAEEQRHELSKEIRALFGMSTREQSLEVEKLNEHHD